MMISVRANRGTNPIAAILIKLNTSCYFAPEFSIQWRIYGEIFLIKISETGMPTISYTES